MIIRKIIDGYVVQKYDTYLKRFVSQVFVEEGEIQFEDISGGPIDESIEDKIPYLPYKLVQPPKKKRSKK